MIFDMMPSINHIIKFIKLAALLGLAILLLGTSAIPPGDRVEQVRAYTRDIEFDYITWKI
jgi:hypothetical protein